MERILASNISEHLEKHNILSNCQHGFRQKRSCETQLIGFIDKLARNMQSGGEIDVIIMDFSKAFDKVLTIAYYTNWPTMASAVVLSDG